MVQLAQYYDGRNPRGMMASEKFDGIRALWNGREFLTRNGRVIDVPARFKKGMPSFEVDGELWCGHESFGLAQGMTKGGANHSGWTSAVFVAFDLPTQRGSFAKRAKKLAKLRESSTMIVAQHIRIKSLSHLRAIYNHVICNGGEGVMLRDSDAAYCRERTTALLKCKPSNEWAIYDTAA